MDDASNNEVAITHCCCSKTESDWSRSVSVEGDTSKLTNAECDELSESVTAHLVAITEKALRDAVALDIAKLLKSTVL